MDNKKTKALNFIKDTGTVAACVLIPLYVIGTLLGACLHASDVNTYKTLLNAPITDVETTVAYQSCFKATWPTFESQGKSINAVYEFCTDDETARTTVNPEWRTALKGEF